MKTSRVHQAPLLVGAKTSVSEVKSTTERNQGQPKTTGFCQPSVNQGWGEYPKFRLIEFNARRRARGVEAARVEVAYSEKVEDLDWMWMSLSDLRKNILIFGPHAELERAIKAYRPGGLPT